MIMSPIIELQGMGESRSAFQFFISVLNNMVLGLASTIYTKRIFMSLQNVRFGFFSFCVRHIIIFSSGRNKPKTSCNRKWSSKYPSLQLLRISSSSPKLLLFWEYEAIIKIIMEGEERKMIVCGLWQKVIPHSTLSSNQTPHFALLANTGK